MKEASASEENAGPGYEAFSAQLVAKLPGKATCVEGWHRTAESHRLLVGLADGTLLVLASDEQAAQGRDIQASGGATAGARTVVSSAVKGTAISATGGATTSNSTGTLPWRVQSAYKSFGGGHILLQLQVLATRGLLLSLCDQGVSVHRLPSFQLTCQATRLRGGKCFAWQHDRAMLCSAVKRRIFLLHYDGKDFLELKSFTVAHSPVCLEWIDTRVLMAFQTGYSMLSTDTGEQRQLATMTKGTPPAFAVLAGGELFLALDGQCQIFSPDGRPTKRLMTWSTPPTTFIFSQPLLAALLPSRLEVRSLRSATRSRVQQTVAASGLTCVSSSSILDGSVFAASQSEVWQLRATPLLQQAEQLAAERRVEEALDLLSLCHSSDQAQQRKVLEDNLHVQLGYQLFKDGAFEEAMLQLGMGRSASAVILLQLFPSLAPPHLLQPIAHLFPECQLNSGADEPTGEAYTVALNVLLPYLLSWRTRLAAATSSTQPLPRQQLRHCGEEHSERAATAESRDHNTPPRDAPSQTLPPPAPTRDAPSSEEHHPNATTTRASVAAEPSSTALATDPDGIDDDRAAAAPELQRLTAEQQSSLAVLLDTAVLKAMLALPDTGQLLRFVKGDNFVDLDSGGAALESCGRYTELVALLRGRNCHDEALRLLRQLSQTPHELPVPATGAATDLVGLPGVWAAVHYIMAIGSDFTPLIQRHSRWVVEADGEAGIDMLLHMKPPAAAAHALQILSDCAPHLAISYLEAALETGAASHREFDTQLAELYLECVLQENDSGVEHQPPVGSEPQPQHKKQQSYNSAAEVALERLKALVLESPHIDADRLLKKLPASGLLEVRALLLEHFHRHVQILRIYLDELQQPGLAESYCDRVYNRRTSPRIGESPSQEAPDAKRDSAAGSSMRREDCAGNFEDAGDDAGDIYLQLLQVYLQPPPPATDGVRRDRSRLMRDTTRQNDMTRMLSRKCDRLDAGQALELLPDNMALETAQRFLVAVLRERGEKQRRSAIVRSLQRASNLAARSELVARQQRSFMVTEERACSLCFKRIGISAVVALPDGQFLQHYSCFLKTAGSTDVAPVRPSSS